MTHPATTSEPQSPPGGRSAGKWAVLLVVWALGMVVWPVYIGLLVWLFVRVFG